MFALKSVPIFCVLGLPFVAHAKLNTDAFIASALTSPTVEAHERNRAGEETTGRILFVDKIQFSTEVALGGRVGTTTSLASDETLLTSTKIDRDYNLKVVPRGFFEWRYERKLVDGLARVEDASGKKVLQRALEERYYALIDHAVAGERAKARKDFLKISEREIAVMTAANRAARTDGRDLLKARETHRQAKLEAMEAEIAFKASAEKLKILDPSLRDDRLVIDDLRSPLEAERELPKDEGGSAPTSADIDLLREKAELAANEAAYSRARASRLLDSFDFTLEQKSSEDVYKVQFTFNIPGLAGDEYGNREKARRAVWSKVEAETAVREHGVQVALAKTNLERAMAGYRIYLESSGGKGMKAISARLKRIAQREDSALVLLIEKNEVGEKMKMTEAAAEALRTYIAYLSATGLLSQNPSTNYLARPEKAL